MNGVATLLENRFLERLRQKDVSLWAKNRQDEDYIRNSLGWIAAPAAAAAGFGSLRSFAREIKAEGWESVAVLGMGGSILSCRVFRDCCGKDQSFPRMDVLDSIHPDAVRDFEATLNLQKTFFIVSSKSGSTVETLCLMDYFYAKIDKLFPGKAGRRFVAVTDPGTSLEEKARRLIFRRIFTAPPDIGGRFSAWTAFGLVPAALTGVDMETLLNRAMAVENDLWTSSEKNPALELGTRLALGSNKGQDKLVLLIHRSLESLGPWIFQMVAEALGKDEQGLLPVLRDLDSEDRRAGPDQLPVVIKKGECVASQFLMWEIAVCAAAFLTRQNPFGEPDVESAKSATQGILESLGKSKPAKKPARGPKPDFYASGIPAFCDPDLKNKLSSGSADGYLPLSETLATHLGRGRAGDYCVVLAYAAPNDKNLKQLHELAGLIGKKTGLETILDFGPAYLHSGGQFYKGGKNCGLFVEINQPAKPLPLPRRRYGMESLCSAQAEGDFTAMAHANRRILRLDLGDEGANHLAAIINALEPRKVRKEKTAECRS